VQFASHPIIPKERLAKLPDRQKDILLVVGKSEKPLTEGEQALLDSAKLVHKEELFSLYRLSIKDLEAMQHRYASIAEQDRLAEQHCTDCLHLSFEERPTPHHFYGKGALQTPKGKSLVAEWKLPDASPDMGFVFSAWHWLDHQHHDLGRWHLTLLDSAGQVMAVKSIDVITGHNVQQGWLGPELHFWGAQGGSVRVEFEGSRPLWLDEVLIRPMGKGAVLELPGERGFLWNGYWVEGRDAPQR
jgi:hypothetical protein